MRENISTDQISKYLESFGMLRNAIWVIAICELTNNIFNFRIRGGHVFKFIPMRMGVLEWTRFYLTFIFLLFF